MRVPLAAIAVEAKRLQVLDRVISALCSAKAAEALHMSE
jgi:hypothetical protein